MVILALMVPNAEAVTTATATTEYAAYAINAFAYSVGLGR